MRVDPRRWGPRLLMMLVIAMFLPVRVSHAQEQDVLQAHGLSGRNTSQWGRSVQGPQEDLWGDVTATRELPCYNARVNAWSTIPLGDTVLIYDRMTLDNRRQPWLHVSAFWNDANADERDATVYGFGGQQVNCYIPLADTSMPSPQASEPLDHPQSDAYYMGVLAVDGWQMLQRNDTDIIGDSRTETIIVAMGNDCGSCHPQRVVVFLGTAILFDQVFGDPIVASAPAGSFSVTETSPFSQSRAPRMFKFEPTIGHFVEVR